MSHGWKQQQREKRKTKREHMPAMNLIVRPPVKQKDNLTSWRQSLSVAVLTAVAKTNIVNTHVFTYVCFWFILNKG